MIEFKKFIHDRFVSWCKSRGLKVDDSVAKEAYNIISLYMKGRIIEAKIRLKYIPSPYNEFVNEMINSREVNEAYRKAKESEAKRKGDPAENYFKKVMADTYEKMMLSNEIPEPLKAKMNKREKMKKAYDQLIGRINEAIQRHNLKIDYCKSELINAVRSLFKVAKTESKQEIDIKMEVLIETCKYCGNSEENCKEFASTLLKMSQRS